MQDKPLYAARIDKWQGLVTNPSVKGTEGAQSADNCDTNRPGMLRPRKGMAPLTFDSGSTASAEDIIFAFGCQGPTSPDLVIYTDTAGNVLMGRNPDAP